jgi:hypothetical protein
MLSYTVMLFSSFFSAKCENSLGMENLKIPDSATERHDITERLLKVALNTTYPSI